MTRADAPREHGQAARRRVVGQQRRDAAPRSDCCRGRRPLRRGIQMTALFHFHLATNAAVRPRQQHFMSFLCAEYASETAN